MVIKIFLSLLVPCFVFAEEDYMGRELPKWEFGVAAGYFNLPDYPGADENQTRILPVPYFNYRGEVIRSDREGGLRARFFNQDFMEFDISLGGSFPVSAGDNRAREGMPRLDWMGEAGPRLKIHILKNPIVKLDFVLPIRLVFSTYNWQLHNRGVVFEPAFKFRHIALFDPTMSFFASAGVAFADSKLMDYFYEVGPQYARSDRPAYNAGGGYMGSFASISMVKAFLKQNVFLFAGTTLDSYSGAENTDSPLLKDNTTNSYFLGLAWGFYQSDEKGVVEK